MLQRITNNWKLKLMAFVLAVGLWSHVRGEVNPWEKKTFNVRLVHDPPAHLILLNDAKLPTSVTVTLRGPRHSLSEIRGGSLSDTLPIEESPYVTGGEITAQLDYLQVHRGQQKVPVTIKLSPAIQDMADVVDWKPRDVNVMLDKATSARFLVQPQFVLPSAAGYRVGNVNVAPDSIELSGPSNTIGRVARVRAKVRMQDLALNTPRNVRVPVMAVDSDGDVVKGLDVEPATTQITATLLENQITRRIKVAAAWKGTPALGYHVTEIDIEPPRITVRGPQRILDKVTSLTAPLDLEGATASVSRRVPVILPAGVTPVTSKQILVRIHISHASTSNHTAPGKLTDPATQDTAQIGDAGGNMAANAGQNSEPQRHEAPASHDTHAAADEKALPPPAARRQRD